MSDELPTSDSNAISLEEIEKTLLGENTLLREDTTGLSPEELATLSWWLFDQYTDLTK